MYDFIIDDSPFDGLQVKSHASSRNIHFSPKYLTRRVMCLRPNSTWEHCHFFSFLCSCSCKVQYHHRHHLLSLICVVIVKYQKMASPKVSSGKRRPNHYRRAYELINGRKYFQHKPRRTQRRGQRRRTAKEDNSKEEVVLDLRRRGKPKKADEQPKNRLFRRGRRHNVPVPQFLMLPWWIQTLLCLVS